MDQLICGSVEPTALFYTLRQLLLNPLVLFSGEKTHFKKVNMKRFILTTNIRKRCKYKSRHRATILFFD